MLVTLVQLLFIVLLTVIGGSGVISIFKEDLFPKAFIRAYKYGKTQTVKEGTTLTLQAVAKIEVPKKWFAHFYWFGSTLSTLFLVQFLSTLLFGWNSFPWIAELLNIFSSGGSSNVSIKLVVVAQILFTVHLYRRLYECIFVSVYSDSKMNLIHYVAAFLHYFGCIVGLASHSVFVTKSELVFVDTFRPLDVLSVVAITLVLFGCWQQHNVHRILSGLRKNESGVVVTKQHRLPTGGLFDYIVCPHFFYEILIYLGILLLVGLQHTTWILITLWVICNQIVSSMFTLSWYREKFPKETKSLKAIIPFIL